MKIKEMYSGDFSGETVCVSGWVRTVRASKNICFIVLNDGSCFKSLQIVAEKKRLDDFDEVTHLTVGTALTVRGVPVKTPDTPQPFELRAEEVILEGRSRTDYPLQKKRHTAEFLRTIPHLRPRTNLLSAVFRVRSTLAQGVHRFFSEKGFVYVNTPIITGSDCEGAGEMFRVTTVPDTEKYEPKNDFFGRPVSLTVSGQLEGEDFAMAFGDIYTFGPTFRAERSNTSRHAAEFWMIEPEMAFADLSDDMDLAEELLKYLISLAFEKNPDEMEFFGRFVDSGLLERLRCVLKSDFKRITYTEAVRLLENSDERFEYPVHWGMDLQTEHERWLTEKYFNSPVFVTDYPKEIKAFYMRQNDDGRTVAAMDCLVPGVGVIIGGSRREERLEVLKERMRELGLDTEAYSRYLDLRRYGSCTHSGFGLGFERLVMYVTGVGNIRDVLPYPRTSGSLT